VEAVRNVTRQFVLLLGTLLSFSNGASLFAATICRPEAIAVESPDVFPKDIVPRVPVSGPAEPRDSEPTSSAFANATPQERGEAITALDGSSSLLGNSFNGSLEELSRPGAEFNGLNGEDGSRPTPGFGGKYSFMRSLLESSFHTANNELSSQDRRRTCRCLVGSLLPSSTWRLN